MKAVISHLQEEQEWGPRELQVTQLHLDSWEGGRTTINSGNRFQAQEDQEGDYE